MSSHPATQACTSRQAAPLSPHLSNTRRREPMPQHHLPLWYPASQSTISHSTSSRRRSSSSSARQPPSQLSLSTQRRGSLSPCPFNSTNIRHRQVLAPSRNLYHTMRTSRRPPLLFPSTWLPCLTGLALHPQAGELRPRAPQHLLVVPCSSRVCRLSSFHMAACRAPTLSWARHPKSHRLADAFQVVSSLSAAHVLCVLARPVTAALLTIDSVCLQASLLYV